MTNDERTGLSDREVAESHTQYGYNEIRRAKRKSFGAKLLSNLADPIIRVLLIAVGLEILFTFRSCNWIEVGGILFSVAVSSLVSTASEWGSERAFDKLNEENRDRKIKAIRNGAEISLALREIAVGDILLLSSGDAVPADCLLLDGEVTVDCSALNGEKKEVTRRPGATSSEISLENESRVFSGSFILSGSCTCRVEAIGEQTLFGRIALELQDSSPDSPLKARLAKLAGTISRIGYFSAGLIAFAYLFRVFIVGGGFTLPGILAKLSDRGFVFRELLNVLTLVITVIVVAVPEGLPMMISVVLSSNMKRMLRDRILIKKPVGIETAGSMTLLFTDKTGTLTEGKMALSSVVAGDGNEYGLSSLMRKDPELFSYFARSAEWNRDRRANNPTEAAIYGAFSKVAPSFGKKRIGSKSEPVFTPFRSETKYSSVTFPDGETYVKGAPEYLMPHVRTVTIPGEGRVNADPRVLLRLDAAVRKQTERGIRVLLLCRATAPIGKRGELPDLCFLGFLCIRDRVRRDAGKTVAKLQRAGIRVVMVTGDGAGTAFGVGRETGILTERTQMLDAADLRRMSDTELSERLRTVSAIYRAIPQDKTRLVRLSRAAGEVVGMTGDGVNDAPALKNADVGFAMGSGTSVAMEAGDIVLLDNSIGSIAKTVLYGRTVFSSIRKFVTFQLMMNLAAVGVSLVGQFFDIPTPITIVQMLWVNLIMDTLGGLAFAGEPPLESRMREKPKLRSEPILNRYMIGQIAVTGGYTFLLSVAYLIFPAVRSSFGFAEVGVPFLTGFFVLFIFAGIANCFNARSERVRFLSGIFRNRLFVAIISGISAIQLVMVYFGGKIFRTVPLPGGTLLRIILLAGTVIPADLLRKIAASLSGKEKRF